MVELLVINKADLVGKMPKDIKELIEEKANQKLDWVKKRLIEICIGVENVSKWDNIQDEFIEKVSEVGRKYPKANYTALIKIISSMPD